MPAGKPKSLVPLFIFTALYMAGAVATAIANGNREFVTYIGVMLVLIPCLFAVHRRIGLPTAMLWAFSFWGLLHMAGGLVPIPSDWAKDSGQQVLYSWWLVDDRLKYDQVIHAYGFGLTTALCWRIIFSALKSADGSPVRPTPGILMLCMAAGMGFGAFNEVVEFINTRLVPETNVGGYENTGWDLTANLVGAAIAATAIHLTHRRSNRPTDDPSV